MWIFTKKKLKHKTGSHQLFLAETANMSWPSKPRKALFTDDLGGFLPMNHDLFAPPLAPWHLEPHAGVARHVLICRSAFSRNCVATLRAWLVCLPFSKTNVLKWVFWGGKKGLCITSILRALMVKCTWHGALWGRSWRGGPLQICSSWQRLVMSLGGGREVDAGEASGSRAERSEISVFWKR